MSLNTEYKIQIMRIATKQADSLSSDWESRYKKMVDLIENYKPNKRSDDKK